MSERPVSGYTVALQAPRMSTMSSDVMQAAALVLAGAPKLLAVTTLRTSVMTSTPSLFALIVPRRTASNQGYRQNSWLE
jgi:hypothetical protein